MLLPHIWIGKDESKNRQNSAREIWAKIKEIRETNSKRRESVVTRTLMTWFPVFFFFFFFLLHGSLINICVSNEKKMLS